MANIWLFLTNGIQPGAPSFIERQYYNASAKSNVFTARCYAERGYGIVCLSVRNVEVCFSHLLEYFENTFTTE